MRWFKLAAIAVGVVIAFLVVSSVVGFLVEALIAVLAIGVVVLAVKVALHRRQVLGTKPSGKVRGRGQSRPLRRPTTPDIDDELGRLKREAGQ